MKFVITGLPRSRTAWFAAYFTTEDTLCYHDKLLDKPPMEVPGFTNVGHADSGYVLLPKIDAKVVVIHRDYERAIDFLEGKGIDGAAKFINTMQASLDILEGLHIAFDDINRRLPDIHDYLGIPYSAKRAEVFKELNIQSIYWSN